MCNGYSSSRYYHSTQTGSNKKRSARASCCLNALPCDRPYSFLVVCLCVCILLIMLRGHLCLGPRGNASVQCPDRIVLTSLMNVHFHDAPARALGTFARLQPRLLSINYGCAAAPLWCCINIKSNCGPFKIQMVISRVHQYAWKQCAHIQRSFKYITYL